MTKTTKRFDIHAFIMFGTLKFFTFEFVSDFDIRYSNFNMALRMAGCWN